MRATVLSSAPANERPPLRALPALIAAVACALLLGLSIFPPSSTRLLAWPWAGFASAAWLLPVAVTLWRIARGVPRSRFCGLIDIGLCSLAAVAVLSALLNPLSSAILPHLLPVLGACALPCALLSLFTDTGNPRVWRATAALLASLALASLLLWTPGTRNAQPFGHANITGSVFALAIPWLAAGGLRETRPLPRLLFALAALLSLAAAYASQSRGALLALAAAGVTAAAIAFLRRGRLLLFLLLIALLGGVLLASSHRVRDLVTHGLSASSDRGSNDQRLAMLFGGLRLGAERPLLGWGAGSVPHAFPRVRAGLPGDADNFLQLHNTPVQLWATLGTAGLAAAALLGLGIARRLRSVSWTPTNIALAAGLACAAVILLFDHPFATPVFAALAAAHLAALCAPPSIPRHSPFGIGHWSFVIPALGLALFAPALYATARDLAARRAYAAALDHASANDPVSYVDALRRASALAPGDPYYPHLLAAQLATGHPFPDAPAASPRTSADLLARTLSRNPDLEYAHYNLGWLLLGSDPESAARHFRESARLAPQRGDLYLGLALARIQLDDTQGAARAIAAEWLLDPAAAWSPVWKDPRLAPLVPAARALAAAEAARHGAAPWDDLDSTTAELLPPHRRVRAGYGVLMGHPDGPPPPDFNIRHRVRLPAELRARVPRFGWLDGGVLLRFLDENAP